MVALDDGVGGPGSLDNYIAEYDWQSQRAGPLVSVINRGQGICACGQHDCVDARAGSAAIDWSVLVGGQDRFAERAVA